MKKKYILVILIMFGLLSVTAAPVHAATITVSNTNDSGPGSLRAAIAGAAPGDTIDFSVTGTITLTTGELVINKNLTITGPGAGNLSISGNNASRVFNINTPGAVVNITGLTVTNGFSASFGGGIENIGTLNIGDCIISNCVANGAGNGFGGGIDNFQGTVTLTNSTVINNTADTEGGGICTYGGSVTITDSTISGNTSDNGGGISNSGNAGGTVIVDRSTIYNNHATLVTGSNKFGGGIFCNGGTLTVTNSTISGNNAVSGGGGIVDGAPATINITQSTIAFNSSTGGGGGIDLVSAAANIKNTILANNTGGGGNNFFNAGGGSLNSQGYNLANDAVAAFIALGDQQNANPNLAAIANNGGPTQTHALLAGSTAINAIPEGGTGYNGAPATDQRGYARNNNRDIGAFESDGINPAAEMGLKQGATSIADGGNYDFGARLVGTNTDVIFTIENTGGSNLTLSGTPIITIGGADAGQFSVQAQPTSPVAPAGSTTFTIRFTPTSAGVKNASISIANNDSDENPYDLTLQGTGTAVPEMDVQGGLPLTSIADGDGTPSLPDGTDFGSADYVSGLVDHTFTINNTGSANLNLTLPVNITGAHAGDFTVITPPAASVAPSGSTTFTVRFDPSAVGLRSATISITNDDSNENPYDFAIQGTGTSAPEMNLKQGTANIADGGSYNFGAQVVGTNTDVIFTIENLGSSNLTLSSAPIITITGADAGQFSVQAQPTSPVAPSGNTTFTIRFSPGSAGVKNAAIAIANNDSDENPYDLALQGTGTAVPEMALSQGATPIADGGSYNFGSQELASNTDVVFTITNSGTANLTLTTPITIGGADAGQFSIQAQPTSPVSSGGGTTTFTVRFTPTTTGAKTATISIANNDGDENPYDLTINGTGTAAEMALSQGATPIADGGSYNFGSQVVNSNTDVVFTITNSGTANLTLTTPITIGGADAGQFSIQAQPTSPVASGGGTTTFTVRFTPTTTGAKTATISIANNDGDENPYDLTLTGTGQAPEINLKQGTANIADGGSYDFGSHAMGTDTDVIFTIENLGSSNLTLSGAPIITITGADAGQFSVQAQPTSPVAPSGNTTFTIRFTPTSAGVKNAAIAIANNDSDENPYDLTITGTGGANPPTVTTTAVSNITTSSAKSGGNVTDDGGSSITARGVCWSTSPNPTIAGNKTTNGSGTGAFTSTITGLTGNTTYYLRAYATNASGTAYGNQVTFTTNAESLTVTITEPQDGAQVSGTVTIKATTSNSAAAADASLAVVTKVEFYIDDSKLTEDTTEPYEATWDTTTAADGSHTIKAVAYSAANQTAQDEITVQVVNGPAEPPEIMINRTRLNFGSELQAGTAFSSIASAGFTTGPQTILINNVGGGTLNWTASKDADWLTCTPGSGNGNGMVSVSVVPAGLQVGTYSGTISIQDPAAVNSPVTVPVTLKIYGTGTTTLPFGYFETPTDGATVRSSVPVTGWALDDIEVTSVKIFRDPIPGYETKMIYIGDAVQVDGARPDVEETYPDYPKNYQAGWGYMLLTNFLPFQGNGTFTLYAIAIDKEGNEVTLGSKTITGDNANAVKPFGAIDTPGQGGIASGKEFVNFGWALTPQPNTVPTDGSTIIVWVDGVPLGNPVYNNFRKDIAELFPGYNNTNGAGGYFYLDTTKYLNGVHTIAWSVKDDAGNQDGVGSRFFTILNIEAAGITNLSRSSSLQQYVSPSEVQTAAFSSGPVYVKTGYNRDALPEVYYPDDEGIITIGLKEGDRIEILPGSGEMPTGISTTYGYILKGDRLQLLPGGSFMDSANGIFYWQVGAGYFGKYQFVFAEKSADGQVVKKLINFVVNSKY